MNKCDLFSLTKQFAERPVPATIGRHIYLWHGDLGPLRTKLPQKIVHLFDLHSLVSDLPRTPYSQDEGSRLLRKAIQNYLFNYEAYDSQHIILITGCDLLSRYKVPITDFFSLASEALMFIFIVVSGETNFKPTSSLPDYVSLNPSSTYNYLRATIGEAATINQSEG